MGYIEDKFGIRFEGDLPCLIIQQVEEWEWDSGGSCWNPELSRNLSIANPSSIENHQGINTHTIKN
jgi:hypothetical protein